MRQIILIFIAIFIGIPSFSNNPFGRIYGLVMDAELFEAIPYATVSIVDTKGEVVHWSTTSEDGTFSIDNISMGDYLLKIQFMGYKTFSHQIRIGQEQSIYNFDSIKLEPNLTTLDAVTLVAERTTIEQRIDRKIINVGKDLITVGASASEIMNNVPSVNVDQNGNISLRGNENVRILIDGKPSTIDPAQLLKQIPAASIKSIELITNPSAKYNPEGMSGIINIVLHKNSNNGFNGSLNAGATIGEHTRSNGSIDINYRKKKFNFYGNFGAQFGKTYNEGRIDFPENDYKQSFQIENSQESYLYKMGVDLYLNDRNTLSFYSTQNHYNGKPNVSPRATAS